jgi:Tol biopolymer transport system component
MAVPLGALDERAAVEPVPLIEGVLVRPGGAAKATMSARGSLVYERGESAVQLALVDAAGRATVLSSERRAFVHPRLSPDGRRVAVAARASRGTDLWVYTIADGALTRLTTEGENDFPEWSADGSRLVYRSVGRDGTTLRWLRADGSGEGGTLV